MQTLNHSIVKFDKRSRALVNDGCKLKGLNALLKQTFYPSYSYQKAIKHASSSASMPKHKKIKGSMRLGRGFDAKITQTVKLQIQDNLDYECFWNSKKALKQSKFINIRKHQKLLLNIAKRRNPYVQRFWKLMNKLKWNPKYTQVPVRHDILKIGTMVDVVCRDEKVSL